MIFGLALNVGESLIEVKERAALLAQSKIKKVWVSFSAKSNDPFEAASAVAESVEDLRIGIGVLSPYIYTNEEIINKARKLIELYGKRFDLCIGLGDKNFLKELGIRVDHKGFLSLLRTTSKVLEDYLSRFGVRVWLAAQGSHTLSLSKYFDGVLLNHSYPDYIRWALNKIGSVRQSIVIGLSAPSYLYENIEENVLDCVKKAALKILLGMSKKLARDLNLEAEYERALMNLKSVREGEEAKIVPESLVKVLTITMHVAALPKYIQTLREIGVEEIVFGYPLSVNLEQIKMLQAVLKQLS